MSWCAEQHWEDLCSQDRRLDSGVSVLGVPAAVPMAAIACEASAIHASKST